jgi:hypothetical protein
MVKQITIQITSKKQAQTECNTKYGIIYFIYLNFIQFFVDF